MEQTTLSSGKVLTHHAWDVCGGEPCPLHNPTDHEYRELPIDWKDDWGVMVRVLDAERFEVDPDEYKVRNLKPGQTYILQNSGYCPTCKVELISRYRHDFVSCPCGQFVDGGHDYFRRTMGLTDTSCIYTKV